jgi:hypothetical protein
MHTSARAPGVGGSKSRLALILYELCIVDPPKRELACSSINKSRRNKSETFLNGFLVEVLITNGIFTSVQG